MFLIEKNSQINNEKTTVNKKRLCCHIFPLSHSFVRLLFRYKFCLSSIKQILKNFETFKFFIFRSDRRISRRCRRFTLLKSIVLINIVNLHTLQFLSFQFRFTCVFIDLFIIFLFIFFSVFDLYNFSDLKFDFSCVRAFSFTQHR